MVHVAAAVRHRLSGLRWIVADDDFGTGRKLGHVLPRLGDHLGRASRLAVWNDQGETDFVYSLAVLCRCNVLIANFHLSRFDFARANNFLYIRPPGPNLGPLAFEVFRS